MVFNHNLFSDFHFASPESGPRVTMPINQSARYKAPPVPNELRGVVRAQPAPKLSGAAFYNMANPGKLKLFTR